jgi:hypothetical protein
MEEEMTKYNDSDNEGIHFKDTEGTDIHITTSAVLKEELEKEAEEHGISTSALIRKYIIAGRRLSQLYDPRERGSRQKDSSSETRLNHVRQRVPEGEENAISLDKLGKQLQEDIIDIVEEDDEIKRDGWEIHR